MFNKNFYLWLVLGTVLVLVIILVISLNSVSESKTVVVMHGECPSWIMVEPAPDVEPTRAFTELLLAIDNKNRDVDAALAVCKVDYECIVNMAMMVVQPSEQTQSQREDLIRSEVSKAGECANPATQAFYIGIEDYIHK